MLRTVLPIFCDYNQHVFVTSTYHGTFCGGIYQLKHMISSYNESCITCRILAAYIVYHSFLKKCIQHTSPHFVCHTCMQGTNICCKSCYLQVKIFDNILIIVILFKSCFIMLVVLYNWPQSEKFHFRYLGSYFKSSPLRTLHPPDLKVFTHMEIPILFIGIIHVQPQHRMRCVSMANGTRCTKVHKKQLSSEKCFFPAF